MRPFGCPLTILNTLDSLGKFDGKYDEGYLLGYSTSSKAFRVYNKRTKRVEENLHINFLEDQPNVGTGPNWMFDLDFLTTSMNYIPVSVENQDKDYSKGCTKPSENASPDKVIQDSEDVFDKEGQHQKPKDEQVWQDKLEMMVTQELVANAMNDESRQAFKEEKRRISSQKKAAQATSTNQLSTDRPFVQMLMYHPLSILEAAKTLSKVASQGVSKEKSTDKGKRYRRRARFMAKKIDTGLDAEEEINTGREEINTGREKINTGIKEVSTGSTKVDSGTTSKRGQREGKAPIIKEDIQATHKTKEQIRQEEVGLEEAIKLQAQLDEEVAKQIHLDKMIAKRMAEEETLIEQQKKRKAQVQFEAQFYTEEDWDTIRAKLEANVELSKDVLGQGFPEQDFAKRMVDMVNQRKKHFAEERAKEKRNKPMTQSQLRINMSHYLMNQGTWKLSQLKKLKFEEIKEEFDKLVQQI
ncbi:hypothetical protein Tco_1489218, partial [Tanacetum coccineum]